MIQKIVRCDNLPRPNIVLFVIIWKIIINLRRNAKSDFADSK